MNNQYCHGWTAEKVFLFFGIIWGIIMVFLTPPLEVPDEQAHFFRAYQISECTLFPESDSITLGGYLPASLNDFHDIWAKVVVEEKGKAKVEDFRQALNIQLNHSHEKFINFPNTALYSPIPHLPQAFGILIGRLINLPVILIFYLARLFNLAAFLILLYHAIKITPVYKWLFLMLALMPMTIYLAGSMSGDALTISAAFLFFSLILKNAIGKGNEVSHADFFGLVALMIIVSLSKNAYFPIILLWFVIPKTKFGLIKKYILKTSVFLIPSVALFAVNSIIVNYFYGQIDFGELHRIYPGFPQTNAYEQLRYVLFNPLTFISTLIHSFWFFKMYIVGSHIGAFGWDFYQLPLIHIYLYLAILLAFAVLESQKEIMITYRQKFWILASLIGSLLVFSLMMYMIWAAVGAEILTNLQGRYFIPVIPLFWFLFYNRIVPVKEKILRSAAVVILTASMISTISTIIIRYYAV